MKPPSTPGQTPAPTPNESTKGLGLLRIFKAFFYSMQGLASCFKNEAAFRQEVYLAIVLIPVASFTPVPILAKLWLISSILIVLVAELLNSALEWVVDLASGQQWHPFAKRAKDMGSAAVFMSIVHLTVVWIMIAVEYWEAIDAWVD